MDTVALTSLNLQPETATHRAQLVLAPLSDTGTAVPITVNLKASNSVGFGGFEVFAPDNPIPRLFKIKFGTPQFDYSFETRIRLGASQDVWLVAHLVDGRVDSRVMGMRAPTVLTSSACFDAS